MGETRYFTCMAPEDMPPEWEIRETLRLLGECDAFAGPIAGETGIPGLRLDFRQGLRLLVPPGSWHVRVMDRLSETVFFDADVSDVALISLEKYVIFWQVDVWQDGRHVFSHAFDPAGQEVAFCFLHKALGDTLALLPYVQLFGERHGCRVICHLPEPLRELAARLYPGVPQAERATAATYAVFYMGAWHTRLCSPVDMRTYPLTELGGAMLGLWQRPALPPFRPTRPRPVREKYACIAVQASTLSKGWHYPGGWDAVVAYLKGRGYRVFCIDRHAYQKEKDYVTVIPAGAEDRTGAHGLLERADMLSYADVFVGLSSGLAWVAHAVGCPVVLISGVTHPWHEFCTPYRVINLHVCHGCFNDVRVRFRECFCPYHEGTERELECSKKISPRQVTAAIAAALGEAR